MPPPRHPSQHLRIIRAEHQLEPIIRTAQIRAFNKVLHGMHVPGLRKYGLIAALSEDDIDPLTDLWVEESTALLAPAILSVYRAAAREVLAKYPAIAKALGSDFLDSVRNVRADAYLATIDNRLVGIGDTAFKEAQRVLQASLEQGLSVAKTAEAIRESLGVSLDRATTIARTEAAGAVNGADWATFSEMNARDDSLNVTQEWLATFDGRTRPSHEDADGQVVPIDEPFDVGGEALMFPGDPSGSAEEVCNCRCTTLTSLGETTSAD